jgi:hypothetical protein
VAALNEDLNRFNNFFIDKEENAVIKLQDMSDQLLNQQATREDLLRIKQRLVDFHGESFCMPCKPLKPLHAL